MLTRIQTSALSGLEPVPVEVEVRVRDGKGRFDLIGLGDSAVRESRDRISSAIRYSGFKLPKQILVNLAPANVRKEGSAFDLPIAVAVLAASGQIDKEQVSKALFFGELSLDGGVRKVKGAINYSLCALKNRRRGVVCPQGNFSEVSLIKEIEIAPVTKLSDLRELKWQSASGIQSIVDKTECDPFSGIVGQAVAKRALVVAASGGHHLLMLGPPGCGKSLLASRFTRLLPKLSNDEMLETVRIHSSIGLPLERVLTGERPFRSPHHQVSEYGLIGGGSSPRPGEISLAHNGVIFLDELPEFKRPALEALRVPLETGTVSIARAKGSQRYPARFQLLAAMNLCPCGKRGTKNNDCLCAVGSIERYLGKISRPILDRLDLHVELDEVPIESLIVNDNKRLVSVDRIQEEVAVARNLQIQRQGKLNSELDSDQASKLIANSPEQIAFARKICSRYSLSARGFVRMIKVARTIADIEKNEKVLDKHLAEAISFRALDRIRNV